MKARAGTATASEGGEELGGLKCNMPSGLRQSTASKPLANVISLSSHAAALVHVVEAELASVRGHRKAIQPAGTILLS